VSQGPRSRIVRGLIAAIVLLLGRRRRHDEDDRRRAEPPPARELEVGADRRSENGVLVLLALASLAALGFVVFYVLRPNTQFLGLTIGLAFACLAAAAGIAAKRLVPREKVVDEYHDFGDEDEQEDVAAIVEEGGHGVSRRKLLLGAAGTAGATLGAAMIVPAASLGPRVDDHVRNTQWRRGRRLVDTNGVPVRPEDIDEGGFITCLPEGANEKELSAGLIVVRLRPDELDLPPEREGTAPGGVVAYSKICTHAGCAVSMFRNPKYQPVEPSPALVCPCHYSTFDPRRGGKVTFGPAGRPLPQLPLALNSSGELVAAGDFYGQVGPSYGGVRRRT
jgi:ubiquinol-cytochrome c reductase iron-sulfur subunit